MAPPSWDEIKHRIAARTGLTLDDELEAYSYFCKHADKEDGVLLEGDIQHEFYKEFMVRCGFSAHEIEQQFYKGNIEGKHVKAPYPESPITLMARDSMEYYRTLFEEKNLVSAPISM
ncbi:TPA: hypothetical protein HA251_03095, partial [Candidatus Woesearchaeota archaeon]|nr:hypothetical protein [Candidatus Woesearchaeota archaeon]